MKKLINKSFHRKDEGFTLIELLIVIVIIGILAGVLISVVNPVRQQNRARNAAVRSAVMKNAFAVNTVRAGIGRLPSNDELDIELENIQKDIDGGCDASSTELDCTFTASGTTLPPYCGDGAESWNPTRPDGDTCKMRVFSIGNATGGNLTNGQFRIAAAKHDLDTINPTYHLYIFDSGVGLLECGQSVDWDNPETDLTPGETITSGTGANECIRVDE